MKRIVTQLVPAATETPDLPWRGRFRAPGTLANTRTQQTRRAQAHRLGKSPGSGALGGRRLEGQGHTGHLRSSRNGSNTKPDRSGYREEIESKAVKPLPSDQPGMSATAGPTYVLPGLAETLGSGAFTTPVSMRANRKLAAPGPEVSLPLGRINQWLAAPALGQPLRSERSPSGRS